MNVFFAVVLGVIMGAAELFPVSAPGHAAVLQCIFPEAGLLLSIPLFDFCIAVGVLAALSFCFRRDLRGLLVEFSKLLHSGKQPQDTRYHMEDRRMIGLLIIGSIPAIAAIFLRNLFRTVQNDLFPVAAFFVLNGFILYFCCQHKVKEKDLRCAAMPDALLIGAGQLAGCFPGMSRMGAAVSAGLYRGLSPELALRFTALLSVPFLLFKAVLALVSVFQNPLIPAQIPLCLLGMLFAALSAFISVKRLHTILNRKRFGGFAYYCWGAGIVTLFLAFLRG